MILCCLNYLLLFFYIKMCGIFTFFAESTISDEMKKQLYKSAMKCKHRGPDNTHELWLDYMYLIFHRLIINDETELGDQPMVHPRDENIILLCNGEIYNCSELAKTYGISTKSHSDCEIILHMYKLFGIEKTISYLDGEFAFILIDRNIDTIYAGRDPIGVRPLYIGSNTDSGTIGVSSEMKSLNDLFINIKQVSPGTFVTIDLQTWNDKVNETVYYHYNYPIISEKDYYKPIRSLLTKAVEKRLMSDKPIGCLLSGGLDSSLIAGILSKYYEPHNLHTFSIGLPGSEDLKYAKMVADYLETTHHEYVVSEEEMLSAIKEVIILIESYDTTTIRASVPMHLMAKRIKSETDITVLLSGEGADEASGSYLYFRKAPSDQARQEEILRLMKDLSYYDVLRADKTISGAGLELRVPFLDKDFLAYYLSIPPNVKHTDTNKIEKHVLRSAFSLEKLIPDAVLWRRKEAFSDGVSSQNKSWFSIIQDSLEGYITDKDLEDASIRFKFNTPRTKEEYYYRDIYNKEYPKRGKDIPYFWMPKWSDTTDPSARTLDIYKL
jgi:asparagine synthase (glutamine-hydrolysing)